MENCRNRIALNKFVAIAFIVLSALVLSFVLGVLATGWERNTRDQGAAAHIVQLLMVAQLPLRLAYLVTANWSRWRDVVGHLVLQGAAIGVALAPVAYFKL